MLGFWSALEEVFPQTRQQRCWVPKTTNPIESTFATVRHRTRQTKGCGSRKVTLTMAWKLAMEAQQRWRRLNGCRPLEKVIAGVVFEDGEERSEVVAPAA